ncbi:serine protease [Aeromicrobium camelliae]|uniref:Serine protease n=1 Tax=Aeromicrobium camelliae TaxID=1538144 RepID=A0A3N6ZDF9_9ACTN|nr:MarP family serine protease [Aeromicrobium camelliae]RQN08211.1 serine protease [Aeromicrobium camelliae]
MNTLDLILLGLVALYAASGFVHGFVLNLIEGIGLIAGGLIGVVVAPWIFGGGQPLLALLFVVGCLLAGQFIGRLAGRDFRVKEWPWRAVDAVAGAALGVAAVLAAAWALGYAVSGATIPYLSQAVRTSAILERVDRVMPTQASDVLATFSRSLTDDVFPRYLEPFQPEVITSIEPPDDATLALPGVQSASGSVVKIVGSAQCGRGIEGSGFVYADGRIMTNAHVVAGVSDPIVEVDGRRVSAVPVVFDPGMDIAVLRTESLDVPALEFDTSGSAGDAAAVLGYPENGPFDARAARIRDVTTMRATDIYGQGEHPREAFSVRSLVRSGNSGGPLVSEEGRVYGVIFAASVSDPSTGYAVTARQAAGNAQAGIAATERVSTGGCV